MEFTTKAFKTRSEIIEMKNLEAAKTYPIALDIGYSAVKGMSPNCVFCFPAFAREQAGQMVGTPKDTDIFYKGEDGIVYTVGEMAVEGLSSKDTDDSTNTLYGRNRYYAPSFKILARVGMALAMKTNSVGGYDGSKPIFLQTGLPPAFRRGDTPALVEVLAGNHRFSVKFGSGDWNHYNFTLAPSSISVIDQPIGSIYSASKNSDGSTVIGSKGKPFIDSHVLVFDGGFGTLDIYSVANRTIDGQNSFQNLGMKAVFERTCADLLTYHRKEMHVHTLQNVLETGVVSVYNKADRSTTPTDFSYILEDESAKVCEEALMKIETTYNDLEDYDYLLVTGGTGAAWLDYIKDRYKNMETLEIITGNQNQPELDHIYSNVRGYYLFRALQ